MSKDVDFLKDVFLSDLDTGEKSRIVKVEGAEIGHDHLRIYTQSAEQKENGIVTLFKVFSTEEAAEQIRAADLLTCPQCEGELHNGYCQNCKAAFESASRKRKPLGFAR